MPGQSTRRIAEDLAVPMHSVYNQRVKLLTAGISFTMIDQYQVSTDKRSGSRPTRTGADDEQYIVRLVGQAVRVSVETVRIITSLPTKFA